MNLEQYRRRNVERDAQILAVVRAGATYQQAADQFGLCGHAVYFICRKGGLRAKRGRWAGMRTFNESYWYRREKQRRKAIEQAANADCDPGVAAL